MAKDIENLQLGKKGYVHDERTLMLAKFLKTDEFHVPEVFDFDKSRRPFPIRMWGNDEYGDCVIAGRCNHILRLERVEQRRTISLFDADAITEYKKLTGCQEPGDNNDTGLVVLDAMREWKNTGMQTDGRSRIRTARNYSIAAYGEIEPQNHEQSRAACFAFHGVHFGFWLPLAAQKMTGDGVWDYNGETGEEWQPGSWGGHLVYSKAFDPESHEVLTWGMKVKVTNNFIDKYSDEEWAVVDNLDSWRIKQTIDVPALTKQLQQISGHVNE